ncbi:hypothetical protein pb186bvf_012798 [Paramecium bursaria]
MENMNDLTVKPEMSRKKGLQNLISATILYKGEYMAARQYKSQLAKSILSSFQIQEQNGQPATPQF